MYRAITTGIETAKREIEHQLGGYIKKLAIFANILVVPLVLLMLLHIGQGGESELICQAEYYLIMVIISISFCMLLLVPAYIAIVFLADYLPFSKENKISDIHSYIVAKYKNAVFQICQQRFESLSSVKREMNKWLDNESPQTITNTIVRETSPTLEYWISRLYTTVKVCAIFYLSSAVLNIIFTIYYATAGMN